MKNTKFIFLLIFVIGFFIKVNAALSVPHKIDSLKESLLLFDEDISLNKKGEIFKEIAALYNENSEFEKANTYYKKSLKIFESLKIYRIVTGILFDLGTIEIKRSQFDKAISYYFKTIDALGRARAEFSEVEYDFNYGVTLMHIGIIYEETQNYNQALKYLYESNEILQLAKIDSTHLAASHINLGMTYNELKQPDLAKKHFTQALTYIGNSSEDEFIISSLYSDLGYSYYLEGNFKDAIIFFTISKEFHESNKTQPSGYTVLLINLANTYLDMGKMDSSKLYLDSAYQVSLKDGGGQFLEGIYEARVRFYTKTGQSKLTLENLISLNEIKEKLYAPKIVGNIAKIQYNYDIKKAKEEEELKLNILKKNQLLGRYKWYTTIGALVIFLLIFMMLFYKQRHKIKLKSINLKNVELEKEKLSNKLEFKNSQLTNYALHILRENEFLDSIKSEIDVIHKNPTDVMNIKLLSSNINTHISSARDRKDFEINIEKENQDFYFKLHEKFPKLTANDKKLCSLLLLNLSSKEIASITNISVASVETSRHRLRKKINLQSGENISEFLNQL